MTKLDLNAGHKLEEEISKKIYDSARKGERDTVLFLTERRSDFGRNKYAIKTRAKRPEALIEKVERKKKDKKSYGLANITDALGLRVVSLFKQDLPHYLDRILFYFSDKGADLENNPFIHNSIKEVIVYTTHKDDPETKIIKSIVDLHDVNIPFFDVVEKKEKYSSIHIVAQVNQRLGGNIKKFGDEFKNYTLPVEIQLRTVFEDAWGEIDHLLKYKEDNYLNNISKGVLASHIVVLKKFVDACANYSDIINFEAMSISSNGASSNIYDSCNEDEDIKKELIKSKVDKVHISGIMEVRSKHAKLREEIEHIEKNTSETNSNSSKQKERLIIIADKIIEHCKNSGDDLCDRAKYFYMMEEAHLRLNEGSKSQIIKALNLYNYIERKFNSDAKINYRIGLAYSKLDLVEESINYLEKALEILKNGNNKFGYMNFALMSSLSYQYFSKAHHLSAERKDCEELIKKSIVLTKGMIKEEYVQSSLHKNILVNNNLLYYLSYFYDLTKDDLDSNDKSYLEDALAYIMDKVDSEETSNIRHIDTLAYALILSGDTLKAKRYAFRVVQKIREKHAQGVLLTPEDMELLVKNSERSVLATG